VAVNPFYDAAVRSMGTSWHAFLTGAIDPSASIAIDKPPVDLWLQVASTRLLGFTPIALHLPEALGGILAVLALYDLLRVLFGGPRGWPARWRWPCCRSPSSRRAATRWTP
jgi:4-amino-4-deoxy-L-arabinose transferase-like glycosyltransferase